MAFLICRMAIQGMLGGYKEGIFPGREGLLDG